MGVVASLIELSPAEIEACRSDPAALQRFLSDAARPRCDLDKAWAGLHFLFVHGDYEFEAAMLDDERARKMGGYDVLFVSPRDMPILADNFEWEGRAADLAKYYDPARMAGIYPDIWAREGDKALEYLLSFVPALRRFTDGAASRGHGAVVVIG